MARQAVTKAAEKQEIGWEKVESADALSPSDWEVEVTEVFRRRADKIRESHEDPGHVSEGLPFSSWSSGERLHIINLQSKEGKNKTSTKLQM